MRGRRFTLAVVAAVSSAGVLAITASGADTAAESAVTVSLVEWKLLPEQVTVRAGRVSFVVRNDGTMDHEFRVLRSDRHHHSLKVKKGLVVETAWLGGIRLIPKGTTKQITMKVPRGRYVMLCNMLGHYQAGQFASLRAR